MSLDFDVTARLVPFVGVLNARDVGGYDTPSRPLAWGRLIRTAGLDQLDEADRAKLALLGVRTVLDLRRDDEREDSPSALAELDVAVVHISISAGAPRDATELPDLETVYRDMVRSSGPALAAAVSALAEPTALPAVVHCTAGKDRTGVVVALVLALVGVDDDTIAADYAASADLLGTVFVERLAGADAELAARVMSLMASPPELIRAVLAEMRELHGDVDSFLIANGMAPDVPDRLRTALLET